MEGLWSSIGVDGRDPRLGFFASGGVLDGALPSGRVLGVLECLAVPYGPGGRPFAGASHDEAAGMLFAAAAVESHVAGLKLALVREIIRRYAPSAPGGRFPDPGSWRLGVLHEVAAVLRISVQSADPVVDLAWQLEARLPGVGELLDGGVLSWLTAKIIAEEFSVLDGELLAEAERRLLGRDLAGDSMTPGRVRRLCQAIADAVDPEGAARRREEKEREEARVRFYRAHGGAGALFATGLPADEALKSQANIQKRALEYKAAGIREKMDFLRVLALVDLTNELPVAARLARWQAEQGRAGADDPGRRAWEEERQENANRARYGDRPPFPDREPEDLDDRDPCEPEDQPAGGGCCSGGHPDPDVPPFPDKEPDGLDGLDGLDGFDELDDLGDPTGPGDRYGGRDGRDCDGRDDGGDCGGRDDGTGDGDGDDAGPGEDGGPGPGGSPRSDGPGGGGNGGAGTGPVPAGMPDPGLPALVHLTCPLATVLGQADLPGEAPGYGSLDPALARRLAAAAARSPRSGFCVTFTDEEGHAAAHGCARLIGGNGKKQRNGQAGKGAGPPGGSRGSPAGGWGFARDRARPGPEGGYGTWILTLPSGRAYRVQMHAIALHDCDHRYATDAWRPGALLRHLVEVRDGECTFTGCSRPATESDFEHAIPYHQGGKTDACNAGMRSRRCHRVKQSPGWDVTQPEPGWHQWRAPSGRTYTKGPKNYPA